MCVEVMDEYMLYRLVYGGRLHQCSRPCVDMQQC